MLPSLFRRLMRTLIIFAACIFAACSAATAQTGTWAPVANPAPHYNEGVMLLLTDGSIICKTSSGGDFCPADDNIGNKWDKLTPVNGSYVNGTWSTIAAMDSPRLYFSSQVLRDGRVYVCGGEYGGGGKWGEIYDPVTDKWSPTGTGGTGLGYPFLNVVSDANSELLYNGKILQACVNGAGVNQNFLYDPITNSYTAGPNCLRIDNEAVWVKLPDGSVLFMDNYGMTSERYIPATNTWVNDATAPINLFDPYGYEAGAAYLLPDGRVWFIGSTPNTLYYTPSGSASPGTWAVGPAIPLSKGAPDAASVMMPNGHVLLALSPTPTAANHFPAPTTYYEFDYTTNTFTQVSAPGGGLTFPYGCYISNMLQLPDGNVLFCNSGFDQYYVYTPGGTPLAAGRPTIDSVISGTCNSYMITGKLFNGISEGAAYGDDWQMSTNYPIVRLTSGTNIYYATSSNWNRQGAVMTGALEDTATFTLPAGLPIGTYSVTVIANGNPSAPRPITTTPGFVTGPIMGAASLCSSATTTLTDTTFGGVWSSSNPSVATVGSSTGVVTGISGGTATISYTKLYSCGYQSVTLVVTVNLPTVSAITGTSLMYIGSINAFSDATAGGTWSSSNTSVCTVGSTGIVNGIAVGTATISYVVTNSCGSALATILVTVSGCTPIITTVAGTGTAGYSGDGGSALSATMIQPYGIYFGHAGDIYFSDGGNSAIRKIAPSGIITTVAGNGTSGYSGDGGPATAAKLNDPGDVITDALGNMYIADTHNNRIRKVSTSGIITTIAGTGTAGYSGDGGPATAAKLNYPQGVVMDLSGNLYVSEYFNNCVRKISPSGIITTIAGNGTAGFSGDGGPATAARLSGLYSISMDAAGNLYIADGLNNRARKINTSGIISTIAGGGPGGLGDGGPATAATINVVIDVVADASGNVYISDGNNSRIRKVNPAGIISTIAGIGIAGFTGDGGPAPSAEINHPGCVAFDGAGVFYLCDWANNRIRKITTAMPDAGTITGVLTIPVGSTTNLTDATIGGVWSSSNMAVGTVNSTGVVTGITVGTTTISYTVTNGCGSASAITIVTVVPLSPVCGGIITTVAGNGTAAFSGDGGLATSASINQAYDVTFASDGSMYICDSWNGRIRKVSPTGIISTIAGNGIWGFAGDGGPATAAQLSGPTAVVTDAAGNLYITDQSNHRIRKINTSGIITTIAGSGAVGLSGDGGPATAASMNEPTAIAIDAGGNIYIADQYNNRIRKVTPAGTISTYAGTTGGFSGDGGPATAAQLSFPCMLCFDPAGNLYVTDFNNNRVRKITPAGIISTYAGSGSGTTSGDGGPATAAGIHNPWGIKSDASGNIYTGVFGEARVRKINTSGVISTIAGTGVAGYSGDGGLATAAKVYQPSGVYVDGSGNIYFADEGNSRIRRIGDIQAVITGTMSVCVGSTTSLNATPAGGTWSSLNPGIATIGTSGVVTGIAPGTATISYTVSTVCGNIAAAVVVTVNLLPFPDIISGVASVCAGSTTSLSDIAPGGVWSSVSTGVATISSTGIVTGISSGTSIISYTITNSCGTMAATRIVTVNPGPVVAPITGTPMTCVASTTALTDATGGGTWSSTPVAVATVNATGAVTGISAGTAAISYTITSGCGTTVVTQIVTVNLLPAVGSISGTAAVCVSATTSLSDLIPGGVWSSVSGGVATVGSTGIVTGISAGTSTISYTVTNSCGTAAATVVVTVSAAPVAGSIMGTPVVCVTATTALTDATGGGTWSSSFTGVATVGSTGTVTGVSAGTATISYTVTNSCGTTAATQIVTVNALPAAGSISGTAAVCVSATTSLTDATPGGVWSSVSAGIATVGSTGIVTGVSAGTSTISYTVTNSCGTAAATRVVTVIAVPAAGTITGTPVVCVGATTALTDAAGGGAWSSVIPGVASIGTSGIVTGVTPGTTTISYTVSNSCGTVAATVVVTVNPLPNAGTITGSLSVCTASTAVLTDATGGGVWSSVSAGIATVGSTGIVTGVSAGTSTISYTATNSCGTAAATVVVTVIALPSAGSITGTPVVCVAATTALTDAAGGGVWSSVIPGVAGAGTSGIVTGVTAGTTTISYTVSNSCGTVAATVVVTVNPLPAVTTINGTPVMCPGATASLSDATASGVWSSASTGIATVGSTGVVTGISAGTSTISYAVTNSCGTATATIVATVNPAAVAVSITGTPVVCATATTVLTDAAGGGVWSSVVPGIASVGTSGIVTGVTAGTSTISYTVSNSCGTVAATVVVTVNPLPAVTAINGLLAMCPWGTVTLTDATAGGVWSSVSPWIATVGPTGIVTAGVSAGTTIISYTITNSCGVIAATDVVTVNPSPYAGIILGALFVCPATTSVLTDPAGAGGGVWSSADPGIAVVSSSGLLTAITPGTTVISYTFTNSCGTGYATAIATVNPLPNAGFIEGAMLVCPSTSITLSDPASGGSGIWSSASPAIASIGSASGVLTGIAAGTTVISYIVTNSCGTAFTTTTATVHPFPAAIAGPGVVCQGNSATLSDSVAGGTWSSGNSAIATVAPVVGALYPEGLVSGVTVGTTVISYVIAPGCFAAKTITVNPLAPVLVAGHLCAASTEIATDATSGGIWSSNTVSVATISSTGIVTGVESGVTLISYSLGAGCTAVASVTVNMLPPNYYVTGGGNYCSGATGVHIGLDGSDSGVSYRLLYGTSSLGTFAGTNFALDFGAYTLPGIYTVLAINDTTACVNMMGDSATITVSPSVTPFVSISANPGTTICAGTMTTFTSLPVNGGTSPLYSWYVNGTGTGSGNTFSYIPANGDVVSVVLASNAVCALPATATNSVVMATSGGLSPSLSISVSPSDSVCPGAPVVITPLPAYGGTTPLYSWLKNGIYAGSGSTYSFLPTDGDNVLCRMRSSITCSLEDSVYSNNINMRVPPIYIPAVAITAIPGNPIAAGETVTLIASATFAGLGLTYQWEINGNAVPGATNDTFIHSGFGNHDVVDCAVTGYSTCGSTTRSASVMIVDSVALGVTGLQGNGNLKLIPNPNNGQFRLYGSLPGEDDHVSVEVTNMLGQAILTRPVAMQSGAVDEHIQLLDNLANGMYLLNVTWSRGNKVFHFVVER